MLDNPQAVLSHNRSEGEIVEQALKGACQGVDIKCMVNKSIVAIVDKIRVTSHSVGNDNRSSGVHDFIDNEAPGLVHRRQDEDIAKIVKPGKLSLVLESEEANA